MLAALAAFAGVAAATPPDCTITGTRLAEFLPGTADSDVLCALGGDDGVQARESNDKAYGNQGNDGIDSNQGDDLELGGGGNDSMGNICFSSNPSVECFNTIPAEQIVDVGSDTFRAGAGDDTVFADDFFSGPSGSDGPYMDIVNCGTGNDTVFANAVDRVNANCETVIPSDPPVANDALRSASYTPESEVFRTRNEGESRVQSRPGPPPVFLYLPYSPNVVEGEFSEVRLNGVLRSSSWQT
jgi:RTX calcium-binding nonapeptide repeat (4 copies)